MLILLIGSPILALILRCSRPVKITAAVLTWTGLFLFCEWGADWASVKFFLGYSVFYFIFAFICKKAYGPGGGRCYRDDDNLILSPGNYWHPMNIWHDRRND
jgi:hypothetical protein